MQCVIRGQMAKGERLETVEKGVRARLQRCWHTSREVRRWLSKHNRELNQSGEGMRIVSCLLPKQSPWLNAIEPKWVHGKRKVVVSPRGWWELMS
jgi:hypothetical protein